MHSSKHDVDDRVSAQSLQKPRRDEDQPVICIEGNSMRQGYIERRRCTTVSVSKG